MMRLNWKFCRYFGHFNWEEKKKKTLRKRKKIGKEKVNQKGCKRLSLHKITEHRVLLSAVVCFCVLQLRMKRRLLIRSRTQCLLLLLWMLVHVWRPAELSGLGLMGGAVTSSFSITIGFSIYTKQDRASFSTFPPCTLFSKMCGSVKAEWATFSTVFRKNPSLCKQALKCTFISIAPCSLSIPHQTASSRLLPLADCLK